MNLTDGTQYSYSIAAYDVQGNISIASAPVAASTFDWIAPTAPGTLTAQMINSQQINLAWAAATDNVGVAGYIVYAGFSPTSLLPAGNVTGTATVRAPLLPNTTYYFAVSAVDAANNISPRSAVASATTATLASKWR
jgi:chitinase